MDKTTSTAATPVMTLLELQKRLEPLYAGIGSIIRQLKERKTLVPRELENLQRECSSFDRKIDDLAHNEDGPAVDIAGIDQEIWLLEQRVTVAVASFK